MELQFLIMSLFLALTMLGCIWAVVSKQYGYRRKKELRQQQFQLPPGPKGLPLLGNIFQLGWAPHVSFNELARIHGPIMFVRLGSMKTVVISSNHAACSMFKDNDVDLAGRMLYEAMKGKFGNEGSLITAQYGPHWRTLKRLCTNGFFITRRLDATRDVRGHCIDQMIRYVGEASGCGTKAIDVWRFIYLMNFNLLGKLMFSKDLLDPKSKRGASFFHHAGKVMQLAGKPNVADFFPVFKCLDPQGIKRKMDFHLEKAFDIAGSFIQERMHAAAVDDESGTVDHHDDQGTTKRRDFLDALLDFRGDGVEEPNQFSSRIINAIVLEMFIAGTDTTTSTLEWAMAELIRNPIELKKVQTELREVVVGSIGKVEEKDLEKLPYLKAVINETLRLHPPLPFLVPHMAMKSCYMLGYHIPQNTQVLVNVWGIGRDPKTWKDPLVFNPERFNMESKSMDYKGHHYEFLPFGSGRRKCPAIPLASIVLPLTLGSLLYSFDWALSDGLKPELMDMSEQMGITLRKVVPLKAIPIPYKGYYSISSSSS